MLMDFTNRPSARANMQNDGVLRNVQALRAFAAILVIIEQWTSATFNFWSRRATRLKPSFVISELIMIVDPKPENWTGGTREISAK